MRIKQLKLVRYGHFADERIDLPSASPTVDLHIIYGDNEAGKSTTFAALLDFLFGIPLKSRYTFRYERKDLRIEAHISDDHNDQHLIRTGRGLIDTQGNTLDPLALSQSLSGLDRASYGAMFSMDEESLKEGGEAILASKGELGSLLFSAGAGIAQLESQLARLTTDSIGAYYDAGGARKTWPIMHDIESLKHLDAEIKSLDVQAKEWSRRRKRVSACEAATTEAVAAHTACANKEAKARALLERHKRATELVKDQAELQAAEPTPTIPSAWWSPQDTLLQTLEPVLAQLHEHELTLAQLIQTLEGAAPPQDLIDAERSIQPLRDQLPVLDSMAAALKRAQPQKTLASQQLAAAMQQLNIEADTTERLRHEPLINESALDHCRELAREHGALSEAVRQTEQQQLLAQRALEALPLPSESRCTDAGPLKRLITEIEQDSSIHGLDELQNQLQEQQDELAESLHSLAPWHGSAPELLALSLPAQSSLQAQANAVDKGQQEETGLMAKRTHICHEIDKATLQLSAHQGLVDDTQWLSQIEDQWLRWRTHRDAIATQASKSELQRTADDFEHSLRITLKTAAERESQQASIAQARATQAQIDSLQTQLAHLDTELIDVQASLVAAKASFDALIAPTKLPPDSGIDDVASWTSKRQSALRAAQKVATLERQLAHGKDKQKRYKQRLRAQLVESGEQADTDDDAPLEQRLAQARFRVEAIERQQQEQRHQQTQHDTAAQALTRANVAVKDAERALELWQQRWQGATQGSLLANFTPEDALRGLDELNKLATAQNTLTELERQEQDYLNLRDQHERSVNALAHTFRDAIDHSRSDALAALVDALTEALQRHRHREECQSNKQRLEHQIAELHSKYESQFRALQERYESTGVNSPSELKMIVAQCKATAERSASIAEREQDISAQLLRDANMSLAEFVQQDPADLETSVNVARAELEQALDHREQCVIELKEAERSLAEIGDDDTLTLLRERRQAVWLRLKQSAREALAIRLGIGAAREGIRQWRSTHRSDMLADAMQTFVNLTNGRFVSLDAEPAGGGNERLFARTADGIAKSADQLSKGTQYQLYLALRVAAYRRWCKHHSPPPFVADDVLETFDNDRTASTFQAFLDMAQHGQVIYLTHHRHVIDIAREVTGGQVSVHELPTPAVHPVG